VFHTIRLRGTFGRNVTIHNVKQVQFLTIEQPTVDDPMLSLASLIANGIHQKLFAMMILKNHRN
jgi:hypothetical protein